MQSRFFYKKQPNTLDELLQHIEFTSVEYTPNTSPVERASSNKKNNKKRTASDSDPDYSDSQTKRSAKRLKKQTTSYYTVESTKFSKLIERNQQLEAQILAVIGQNKSLTQRINELEAERSLYLSQQLPSITSIFRSPLFAHRPAPIRLEAAIIPCYPPTPNKI